MGFMMIRGFISPAWWCNNHLEKYEFVNGKDDIPYMKWTNKTCFKPPTSDDSWVYITYVTDENGIQWLYTNGL